MASKQPLDELAKLRVQVVWLEEQLDGHEDNFGRQIDKINLLTSQLEDKQRQLCDSSKNAAIVEAKLAALAGYVNAIDESPLLSVLKPANRAEIRTKATMTAFEAAAYKEAFADLMEMLSSEVRGFEQQEYLIEQAREFCRATNETVKERFAKLAEELS